MFEPKKTLQISGAVSMILMGVIITDSITHSKIKNDNLRTFGKLLFVVGWLYTAYVLSKKRSGRAEKLKVILPSLGVLIAASVAQMAMISGKKPPMWAKMLFVGSWVTLGWFVSDKHKGMYRYSGLLAAFLVIGSMTYFLPIQRKMGIADGPGMPMFTLAWVIIAMIYGYKCNCGCPDSKKAEA